MFRTKRSRIRALALTGSLVAAAGTIGAVTFNASAAETAPAPVAPAAAAPAQLRAVAPADSAIPEAIRPPAGSRPVGAYVVVTGTQNYTCVVAAGAATGGYTAGSTPEAQLLGTGGRIHHFAGPSWQSVRDSSLVTAKKLKDYTVRSGTTAVPELLLQVTSHTGKGVLSKADFISRLYTSGGVAPTTTCTAGQTVAISYKALYVFWDDPATPAV